MKNLVTALSLLTLTTTAFAEEIDPSDVTKTNTSAYFGMSNKGDVKANATLAHALDNGQQAMVMAEAQMDVHGDYSASRFQYFHVFNTNSDRAPRAAVSLDLIDNSAFTTLALGGVSLYQITDELTFYYRGGVLAGEFSDDFMQQTGDANGDSSGVGAMAAAYLMFNPKGNDGSYFGFYPEYTYLNGSSSELTNLKTTLMAATPLREDRTQWAQIKLENHQNLVEGDKFGKVTTNENMVWAQYKVFF